MIYGYDGASINEFGLKQMKEISIDASPTVLHILCRVSIASRRSIGDYFFFILQLASTCSDFSAAVAGFDIMVLKSSPA